MRAATSTLPKTRDLLLDVELPVSVSFGGADRALMDVLKPTTDRSWNWTAPSPSPLRLLWNNCAIARGEVGVVEGNFGVRVLQVISRQERLKTLS
jgi:flagellar motor switch protein FliN/FliY